MDQINSLTKPGETASRLKMKTVIDYAYLDDTLFELMLNQEGRAFLTEVLISNYIKNL